MPVQPRYWNKKLCIVVVQAQSQVMMTNSKRIGGNPLEADMQEGLLSDYARRQKMLS